MLIIQTENLIKSFSFKIYRQVNADKKNSSIKYQGQSATKVYNNHAIERVWKIHSETCLTVGENKQTFNILIKHTLE